MGKPFYGFILSDGPRLRKWQIDSRPACLLMFKIKASIRTFLDVKDNKNSVPALAWDCLTRGRHRSVRGRNGAAKGRVGGAGGLSRWRSFLLLSSSKAVVRCAFSLPAYVL